MTSPRVLLLSNSKLYGQELLEWCSDLLKDFFNRCNVKTVLFVPYADVDHGKYASKMSAAFKNLGLTMESIHEKPDPVAAVHNCEAIFVGGGNTFLLLKTLYEKQLILPIREIVLKKGTPYIGSSAGTNVATKSINTTNDMPICFPPSFEALNLVPFNINPHYIEPDKTSTHMGETRDDRIKEFLDQPDSLCVLGLKEGSCLLVEDGKITLKGFKEAKFFQKGKEPEIYQPESDMTFLLDLKC